MSELRFQPGDEVIFYIWSKQKTGKVVSGELVNNEPIYIVEIEDGIQVRKEGYRLYTSEDLKHII